MHVQYVLVVRAFTSNTALTHEHYARTFEQEQSARKEQLFEVVIPTALEWNVLKVITVDERFRSRYRYLKHSYDDIF